MLQPAPTISKMTHSKLADEYQMIIFAEFLPRRWQMADIIGWWASNFMMAPLMEPAGPELGCVENLNLIESAFVGQQFDRATNHGLESQWQRP